jgi:predicted amidohydrolase YtcJ
VPIAIRPSIRVLVVLIVFAVLALAFGPLAFGPSAQVPVRVEPATLVIDNGKIVTVDQARPEAQALAIRGDRIVAIGTRADIKPYIAASTRVIDLKGALAVPGIVESHGHFTGVGQARLQLDLMKTTSWEQIVALVADAVKKAKPGEWISGRGWHQEKWSHRPEPSVEGFPTHESLSRVSPDNPVVLEHASGHATFANARAMALAGITRSACSARPRRACWIEPNVRPARR